MSKIRTSAIYALQHPHFTIGQLITYSLEKCLLTLFFDCGSFVEADNFE